MAFPGRPSEIKTNFSRFDKEVFDFKKLIIDKKNPKDIKKEVAEFRKDFREIKYCFQSSAEAYEYLKFY